MRFLAALILTAFAVSFAHAEDDEFVIGLRKTDAPPAPPAPAAPPANPTQPTKKVEPYTGGNFGLERVEPRDRRMELLGFGTISIEDSQALTSHGLVPLKDILKNDPAANNPRNSSVSGTTSNVSSLIGSTKPTKPKDTVPDGWNATLSEGGSMRIRPGSTGVAEGWNVSAKDPYAPAPLPHSLCMQCHDPARNFVSLGQPKKSTPNTSSTGSTSSSGASYYGPSPASAIPTGATLLPGFVASPQGAGAVPTASIGGTATNNNNSSSVLNGSVISGQSKPTFVSPTVGTAGKSSTGSKTQK